MLILSQQNIYDSIKKREIVMPEEHTGQLGFEYAWKELLARSRQTGKKLDFFLTFSFA
jgi:golgi-specific brefeldin A-resistance guanine nucleotide exchange factor 1